jgi:hypothetical protein
MERGLGGSWAPEVQDVRLDRQNSSQSPCGVHGAYIRAMPLVSPTKSPMSHCSIVCCDATSGVFNDGLRYGDSQDSGIPTKVRSSFGVRSLNDVWRAERLPQKAKGFAGAWRVRI